MADAVHLLQALGLGDYEARAYQALLQHNPVTGYELAKVSGIPRPNIYAVLQKLEERGLALRLESDDATRYVPGPPEEFLERVSHDFEGTLAEAREVLPSLARAADRDYVFNTQGYPNLMFNARAVIDSAGDSLLVAIWPDEARLLAHDFANAEARNVKVTTLCMAACLQECGGCRGDVFRNKVIEPQDARWLMLVPDDKEVLAGEVSASGEVSVVRTRQSLFVDVTIWFIRHSIALAALLLDSGKPLESRLQERTREALSAAGPLGSGGWLAHMHRLLAATGASSTGSLPKAS